MLNIFDSQSGGLTLIVVVIFEAIAVSWGYSTYLITYMIFIWSHHEKCYHLPVVIREVYKVICHLRIVEPPQTH